MTDRPRPPTPDLDALERWLAEYNALASHPPANMGEVAHRCTLGMQWPEHVGPLLAYARALEQRTARLMLALGCIRYEADMGHDLVIGRLTDIGDIARAALAEAPDA